MLLKSLEAFTVPKVAQNHSLNFETAIEQLLLTRTQRSVTASHALSWDAQDCELHVDNPLDQQSGLGLLSPDHAAQSKKQITLIGVDCDVAMKLPRLMSLSLAPTMIATIYCDHTFLYNKFCLIHI